MEEESNALQEMAKTTGKAIDAAREAGGCIARLVSGPVIAPLSRCNTPYLLKGCEHPALDRDFGSNPNGFDTAG